MHADEKSPAISDEDLTFAELALRLANVYFWLRVNCGPVYHDASEDYMITRKDVASARPNFEDSKDRIA